MNLNLSIKHKDFHINKHACCHVQAATPSLAGPKDQQEWPVNTTLDVCMCMRESGMCVCVCCAKSGLEIIKIRACV